MLHVKSFSVIVEYKETEDSRGKERKRYYAVSLFMISWQIFEGRLLRTYKQHHFSASPSPHHSLGCQQPLSHLAFMFVSGCDLGSIQVEHFMCSVRSFKWRKLKQ